MGRLVPRKRRFALQAEPIPTVPHVLENTCIPLQTAMLTICSCACWAFVYLRWSAYSDCFADISVRWFVSLMSGEGSLLRSPLSDASAWGHPVLSWADGLAHHLCGEPITGPGSHGQPVRVLPTRETPRSHLKCHLPVTILRSLPHPPPLPPGPGAVSDAHRCSRPRGCSVSIRGRKEWVMQLRRPMCRCAFFKAQLLVSCLPESVPDSWPPPGLLGWSTLWTH